MRVSVLPALDEPQTASPHYRRYFEAIRTAGFSGEIETGFGHRLIQSTDNSIYQVLPDGVVYPRSVADLQILARTAAADEFSGIVLRPRGGGTGTNGQSLGDGVVVDVSRHMNRILSIDPERRVAVVEAGVVKDQLQAALLPHGLFFPPELSTSNRATIGGMISTDASGQGSILYGKTRRHVRAVQMVLRDGSLFDSRPLDMDGDKPTGLAGEIVAGLAALHDKVGAQWAAQIPPLNRTVTGYDLGHLSDAAGRLDPNAVICGSEGTLGLIATAELALTPIPACAALVTITYGDFLDMLRATEGLMAFGAASIEVLDGRLLTLARNEQAGDWVETVFPDGCDGRRADGASIVEFVADSPDEIERRIAALEVHLAATSGPLGHAVIRDPADISAIWTLRKRAVGLLANVESGRAPVPFVEDTAVPPEKLADYIAAFRRLLDDEGLAYGMFGHADAGVLHVRPDLDLTRAEDRARIRRISDAVFMLTRRYGGVLWGEHGKGVRGTYSPAFFGDLYPAVQSVKALFDPANRFNPGKIAAPDNARLMQVDGVPMRGERDEGLSGRFDDGFGRALNCNGNGACFDFDFDAVMCPSWKATRDRRFSPKGRATLIREWLRQAGAQGFDIDEKPGRGIGPWLSRLRASLDPRPDFSREVKTVMDGCLGCKACTGTCPIKVDVPHFRSLFLQAYHSRYLRPLSDHLVAAIETLLPLATRMRPAYNLLATSRPGAWLMRRIGLVALPRLPHTPLGTALRRRGVARATPDRLAALSNAERARSVILVPDAFVSSFEPQVLLDAVDLALRLGLRPWIAPVRNGKPLHAKGMLSRFARVARRTADRLRPLAATGVPLVGIDPAMTLVFRDEYPKAIGEAPDVLLMQEWLSGLALRIAEQARGARSAFALASHCSEQANASRGAAQWQAVFAAAGAVLEPVRTGCCGMAGTFGHEAANRVLSRRIYRQSWASRVERDRAGDTLLVTGFSCRCQAETESGVALRHPVSALLDILGRDGAAIPG